jgi:Domain of unknown function (DUF4169)
MGELVNLRTERKRAKRRQAEREAATNRLAHGRSKAQRAIEYSRSEKADKDLNHHQIERGER